MMQKEKNKVVAVIKARMKSYRLPGKVMMKIMNKPVLGYLIERAQKSRFIEQIVLAIPQSAENDVIENYCQEIGITCFRGSEEDVLGRMLGALEFCDADIGVDIFGDEPLFDINICDEIIQFYLDHSSEYSFVSNDLKTTFPPGTEIEAFSVKALKDASIRATNPKIREHGTLYIRQHPELYKSYNIEAPSGLHYPEMEIELDTKEDFKLIKIIFENLYPSNPNFSIYDIINFLKKNPEFSQINKNIPREWKKLRNE